ncbi:MAG: groES [Anaerocolumna sp.]|nr:groES [Anaerocolumna sp.]
MNSGNTVRSAVWEGIKMKVKPLKNHLLVKITESEETTKGGIILVGTAKGESNIAEIIETADCFDEDKDILLKGDKILIGPHVGTRVKLDGNEYLIVEQKEVFAVLSY